MLTRVQATTHRSWRSAAPPRPARWCWLVAGPASADINATVGEVGFLRGICMDGSKHTA